MDQTDTAPIISVTTVLSLFSTLAILAAAYGASVTLLPKTVSAKIRILFVWHAFDALIHSILEGSFLWNCFFSYTTRPPGLLWKSNETFASPYLPPNVYVLGHADRIYGADYGTSPFSALWREYAKADKRWGGSDLTVISLELLTVFVAGPMAIWICVCLRQQRPDTWFWMVVLATGELYGGFMTFNPEWLCGSPNLDTSNAMYTWVYLFFFNTLWVWIPLWILWEAYRRISGQARFLQRNGAALRQLDASQRAGGREACAATPEAVDSSPGTGGARQKKNR
ncbi:hypothetical protein LTR53_016989 [Teratosphaeriaceae sp. CCFEE 6253]|nr:hypothetical protein LTR53_016989 [Teratosphaeriaceae sp. CCFEE 6253]